MLCPKLGARVNASRPAPAASTGRALGGNLEQLRLVRSRQRGGGHVDEAEELLSGGFNALKLRMGHPLFADDIDVLRAVRKRISDDVLIMVDFNQGLTFAQAMQYCPALDDEGAVAGRFGSKGTLLFAPILIQEPKIGRTP